MNKEPRFHPSNCSPNGLLQIEYRIIRFFIPSLIALIILSQLFWTHMKFLILVYGIFFLVLQSFFKWRRLMLPKPRYQLLLLPQESLKIAFLSHQNVDPVTILTSKILNHPVIITDNCTLSARVEFVSFIYNFILCSLNTKCTQNLSGVLERLESNVLLLHFKN